MTVDELKADCLALMAQLVADGAEGSEWVGLSEITQAPGLPSYYDASAGDVGGSLILRDGATPEMALTGLRDDLAERVEERARRASLKTELSVLGHVEIAPRQFA